MFLCKKELLEIRTEIMFYKLNILVLLICVLLGRTLGYGTSDIVSARIETCRGCSLNRLPEVKKFVMEDAPFYERIEVKFISGAPPELVILGENDQEFERIPLSNLNRNECNELVQDKGFTKNTNKEEF